MIRLIQRRLIIPRGDTGTFTVPLLATAQTGDASVFTIFDQKTQKKVFEKIVNINGDALEIVFSHADTVNLPVGDYVWDIKFYKDPVIIDNVLVDGTEIDSYYAAFKLPVCEIRQTGDTLLTADDAPTSTMAPEQLNIVLAAMNETNAAKANAANSATAAEASAQSASAAATAANTDAGRAEDAATSASTSASAASDSATAADSAKADAISAMSSAVAANTAAQSALSSAQAAATTATNKAAEATASAAAASDSATAASTSASAASSSANSAASSANSAAASVIQMDALVKTIPVNVSELNNDAGYITDSDVPITNVQVAGINIVENKIANIPIAQYNSGQASLGVVKVQGLGIQIDNTTGEISVKPASDNQIKGGRGDSAPVVSSKQHQSAFYGLAKAAGDTTQSQSNNAVGTYTTEAKTAIQSMLDVPSNATVTSAISTAIGNVNQFNISVVQALPTQDIQEHTIYFVPKTGETNDVYDEYIYINNAWEMVGNTQIDLSNYVQKTDYATYNTGGVVKIAPDLGLQITNTGIVYVNFADEEVIKPGIDSNGTRKYYRPIVPGTQHISTFYGLAKAAGDSTQSASSNAVGTYTNEAKAAIQQMLDVPSVSEVPIENGTGIGSVKTKDVSLNNVIYSNTASGEFAFAEGNSTQAIGRASHAEGNNTQATGPASHAEGGTTIASGMGSHAEGMSVTASGMSSHAEGASTLAIGISSHAEGVQSKASGIRSHAEGGVTIAEGPNSHAEGFHTVSKGSSSHAEGEFNVIDSYDDWDEWTASTEYEIGAKVKVTATIDNETTVTGYICKIANSDTEFTESKWTKDIYINYAHIIGNGTADNARSNAYALDWDGNGYYKGDVYVGANADSTGGNKVAIVNNVAVIPGANDGSAKTKDFEFNGTIYSNIASGRASFAEGLSTQATGAASHAEGGMTKATGNGGSHAEGASTEASGNCSHAEGMSTKATEQASHAEGRETTAANYGSHAEGRGVYAQGEYQHAQGKWNVIDMGDSGAGIYADIVGNGTANNARSNAYALTWTGDGHYAGDVYVHSNADSTGGTKLATVTDLSNAIGDLIAIQTTQPTDPDTKIWIDDDASGSVQVPTVSEMNSALNTKQDKPLIVQLIVDSNFTTVTSDTSIIDIINADENQQPIKGTLELWLDSNGQQKMITDAVYTHVQSSLLGSGNKIVAFKGNLIEFSADVLVLGQYASETETWYVSLINNLTSTGESAYYANYKQISAVADPTNNNDAANKKYVDDKVAAVNIPVNDVQVNGVSVVTNGVANVPIASGSVSGVVKVNDDGTYGIRMLSGQLAIKPPAATAIKNGTSGNQPLTPLNQHEATFYGLAKAAGADMSSSDNAVGTYTDAAKTAIKNMIGVEEGLKVVRLI